MIFHDFPWFSYWIMFGFYMVLYGFYVKFTCFKQCRLHWILMNSADLIWWWSFWDPFLGAIGAIKIGRTGAPRALSGPGGRNHGASQWWMASQLCAPREAKWGLVVIFGAWNRGVGYGGMMRIVFVDGFKHVSLCSTIGNHVLHDDPSNVCCFIYFQGVETTKQWMIKWYIYIYVFGCMGWNLHNLITLRMGCLHWLAAK